MFFNFSPLDIGIMCNNYSVQPYRHNIHHHKACREFGYWITSHNTAAWNKKDKLMLERCRNKAGCKQRKGKSAATCFYICGKVLVCFPLRVADSLSHPVSCIKCRTMINGLNRMVRTHDNGDVTVCTYCTRCVHMHTHSQRSTHWIKVQTWVGTPMYRAVFVFLHLWGHNACA